MEETAFGGQEGVITVLSDRKDKVLLYRTLAVRMRAGGELPEILSDLHEVVKVLPPADDARTASRRKMAGVLLALRHRLREADPATRFYEVLETSGVVLDDAEILIASLHCGGVSGVPGSALFDALTEAAGS